LNSPFNQAVTDAEVEDETGQVEILDAVRVDEIDQSFLDWRFLRDVGDDDEAEKQRKLSCHRHPDYGQ
jgi:hypothetical protein